MAYARRSYSGTAAVTTLSTGVNNSIEQFSIADSSGWPDGSGGAFYALIENEVIDCQSRTGTTVTVVSGGRGASGTPAASHLAGVAVSHVFAEADADAANYAVSQTVGKVTTSQDLLIASGANALARLGITNNRALIVSSSLVSWGQITSAMIATDAVTAAAIAADAVGSSEIAANAVGTSEIATAIAGDGLSGGGGSALAVNTDGTTIETNADALRLKDLGVSTAKLAAASVTDPKLAAALGRGSLGYAIVTADQGSLSSGSTTDLTSLTVTVTAGTSRLLRVSAFCNVLVGAGATAVAVAIRESSTTLANAFNNSPIDATGTAPFFVAGLIAAGSGSHTYKVSVTPTGTTCTMKASSTQPAYILVEDIGAA